MRGSRWSCLILVLSVVAGLRVAEAANPLVKLGCVRVQVNPLLTDENETLGVRSSDVQDAALVAVRAQIPRLRVADSCRNTLYIEVGIYPHKTVEGRPLEDYSGSVAMRVYRRAIVADTGSDDMVSVWEESLLFWGPRSTARSQVMKMLEQLGRFLAVRYDIDMAVKP